ncbi:MAG TPA: hypothetical protein VKP30_13785, partial [Polyangiaceae bacterium]|nr:hypothetical protein [Polyangiaceae bacterium]
SDDATRKPRYQTATFVAVAIGAAGISAGTILRVLAFNEKSTIDAHCDQQKWCDSTGMNAVSKADALQTQSTVYLLLGLAAVGTGIGLAIADSGQPDIQAATLTPVVLPSGAALTLRRKF